MINVGGYLEYCGDIMMHVGKYHEYHGGICGGYHEYREVFSTMGYSNNKRFPPMALNTLHSTHDISPQYSITPMVLMITLTVLKISPTVLKISLHGTQDIPPRYSRYTSMVLKISPTVLNTLMVLSTPTVLHTYYTG